MHTRVNPSFTIYNWGVRGSSLYGLVFVMHAQPLYLQEKQQVSNDQGLIQSEPKSCRQIQIGKYLQIDIIQRVHTVNRVSSCFPKDGHKVTKSELTSICTVFIRCSITETDTNYRQQRTTSDIYRLRITQQIYIHRIVNNYPFTKNIPIYHVRISKQMKVRGSPEPFHLAMFRA